MNIKIKTSTQTDL